MANKAHPVAVVGATAVPSHSSNMELCSKALFIVYICVQGCTVVKGRGTVCFLDLVTFWNVDPHLDGASCTFLYVLW